MSNKPADHRWDSFDHLVTHATWRVLEGLTKGEPLRSLMFSVLATARDAKFKDADGVAHIQRLRRSGQPPSA
jgi:hypothetical protein